MLGKFFSIKMSEWEEEITCQYFLESAEPQKLAFSEETYIRVKKLYDNLLSIPKKWALELILERSRNFDARA